MYGIDKAVFPHLNILYCPIGIYYEGRTAILVLAPFIFAPYWETFLLKNSHISSPSLDIYICIAIVIGYGEIKLYSEIGSIKINPHVRHLKVV